MSFPANVRVVLVQPEFSGNVGAAARAMQTMGLTDLWVVAPACDPRADEACWMANHAVDIVRQLRVAESLAEALADTVFSAATTHRGRRMHYPISTPEETAEQIRVRSDDRPVAIVFGRESAGLTNTELAMCSIQSTIPSAFEGRPLNLAQAVQVYCYALFRAAHMPEEFTFGWNLATHNELEQFYKHLQQTLAQLRTKPASTLENYVARFRRVVSRMPLESRDIKLLHKLLSTFDRPPSK